MTDVEIKPISHRLNLGASNNKISFYMDLLHLNMGPNCI